VGAEPSSVASELYESTDVVLPEYSLSFGHPETLHAPAAEVELVQQSVRPVTVLAN
jgi:hypothetical protein